MIVCNVAIALLLTTSPLSPLGCAYPGESVVTSQETADQLILRSEQTQQVARSTFNLFVHIERDHEAELHSLNPAIHSAAEKVRAHGLDYVDSVHLATKTFKYNRTSTNQATLNTYLTTLNQLFNEVKPYLEQAQSKVQ